MVAPVACSQDDNSAGDGDSKDSTGGRDNGSTGGTDNGSTGGDSPGGGSSDGGSGGGSSSDGGGSSEGMGGFGGDSGTGSSPGASEGTGGADEGAGGADEGTGGADEGTGGAMNPTCDAELDVQDDGSGSSGAISLPPLVISEIDPGQFVELFNTTSGEIDLSSSSEYIVSYPSWVDLKDVGAGVMVPANGYAVIPWPGSFSGSESDAGGAIYLQGSVISDETYIRDFVCWGAPANNDTKSKAEKIGKWAGDCAAALTADHSLKRKVSSTGVDLSSYDLSSAPTPMTCTAE